MDSDTFEIAMFAVFAVLTLTTVVMFFVLAAKDKL